MNPCTRCELLIGPDEKGLQGICLYCVLEIAGLRPPYDGPPERTARFGAYIDNFRARVGHRSAPLHFDDTQLDYRHTE